MWEISQITQLRYVRHFTEEGTKQSVKLFPLQKWSLKGVQPSEIVDCQPQEVELNILANTEWDTF